MHNEYRKSFITPNGVALFANKVTYLRPLLYALKAFVDQLWLSVESEKGKSRQSKPIHPETSPCQLPARYA